MTTYLWDGRFKFVCLSCMWFSDLITGLTPEVQGGIVVAVLFAVAVLVVGGVACCCCYHSRRNSESVYIAG